MTRDETTALPLLPIASRLRHHANQRQASIPSIHFLHLSILMTPETLLLSACTTLTGALGYVVKLLWARVERTEKKADVCEEHREKMQEEIETLKEARGSSSATIKAFQACPKEACPFKSGPARYVRGQAIGDQPQSA